MITVTTSGADDFLSAVMKEIESLSTGEFVTIGIHESDNSRPEAGDINNATLGAIQHFGNDNIPARPWLDKGFESVTPEVLQTVRDGVEDGVEWPVIMERVGLVGAAGVQQYMTDLKTPPNAPETVKQKGTSNPLIEDGELRASVTYQVTQGRPREGIE